MNPIISFIFGMGVGTIITFFTIILYSQSIEKKQRKFLIEKGRAKVKHKC